MHWAAWLNTELYNWYITGKCAENVVGRASSSVICT